MDSSFVSSAYALLDFYCADFPMRRSEYTTLLQNLIALLSDYRDTFPHIEPNLTHFIEWVKTASSDEKQSVSVSIQRVVEILEHAHRRYGDDGLFDLAT